MQQKQRFTDLSHEDPLAREWNVPKQNPRRAMNARLSEPPPPPPPLLVLPDELIAEILAWLPVKTLIQWRCVCKSFKTIISNPQFIKTHLKKITTLSKNKPNLSQRLIIRCHVQGLYNKSCSLYSVYNSPRTDAVGLDSYPLKDKSRFQWVVGSCNGLVCVAVEQDFVVLWNPSTRVFNKLPDLGFDDRPGCYTAFGFGYDNETDDYKVLSIFCLENNFVNGVRRNGTRVNVFSLRNKCWRRVEDFQYGLPEDVSGKFVDGSLNWPVVREVVSGKFVDEGLNWPLEGDLSYVWSIVSFDLKKETFKEVMQPDYGEGEFHRALGVLDGWLCVMCHSHGVRADVWVMKEYGVLESWIKLVSIPYLRYPGFQLYSIPLCISDDGEVLLEFQGVFVIYNPNDGTFRNPVMNGAFACYEAENYIESLVSPIVEI